MFSSCNTAASSILLNFLQLLSILNTKLEVTESDNAVKAGFKHTHYFCGAHGLSIFKKSLNYVHGDAIKKASP